MNKLTEILKNKHENILAVYFTAGYPKSYSTELIINELQKYETDIIEIGMPFSDPVADGKTIQKSNIKALKNGTDTTKIINSIKSAETSKSAKILMGYYNQFFKFGIENICMQCRAAGVDALIIPDLPPEIYLSKYQKIFQKYNLGFIFLITPKTAEKRIEFIDRNTTHFIYVVSSATTTGSQIDIENNKDFFKYLKNKLNSPFLIGFGIKTSSSLKQAWNYANGAIIGSKFIETIEQQNFDVEKATRHFFENIIYK